MYFIVVKYLVKPEYQDTFPEAVADFTRAVRSEPGNLWFDWSRSVDNPSEYVLVEGFADDEAAHTHVASPHFAEGLAAMRPLLVRTPKIISRKVDGSDWDDMAELTIDE